MEAEPSSLVHRRLRAPLESGQALIEPPLSSLPQLLAENRERADQSLEELRRSARAELIQAAIAYTNTYRDVGVPQEIDAPLIMSGHQPELFHAGVWIKNFVLSRAAADQRAIGINLIVDNDVCDSVAIRVPSGTRSSPVLESVSFDAPTEQIPYEERPIVDEATFQSFPQRATKTAAAWLKDSLVFDLWHEARQDRCMGEVIANARHRLEGIWGLSTLEIPLSTVFSQAGFRAFAARLLLDLRRFSEIYNSALIDYRVVNHIRSRSHPVPELVADDGWLEAPLWMWTTGEPRRKRLFVRRTGGQLELTDRAHIRELLPAAMESLPDALGRLEQHGIKLRPRALLTTMYARLVLCDLFMHGIGGAKYDELTDAILARYFGVIPPHYLTATATVTLPLDFSRVSSDELSAVQHAVHELPFHAERYLHDGAGTELVQRKQALLKSIPPRGAKRAWHREVISINEALLPLVVEEQQRLHEHAMRLTEQYRLTRSLGSREFSYCLFPNEFLRGLLLDLSGGKP